MLPTDVLPLVLAWYRQALVPLALVVAAFGAFSAVWPVRSIGLYQWIMARLNWRVSPIDEPRERAVTRVFGALLVIFSLAMLWLVTRPVPPRHGPAVIPTVHEA